MTLQRQERLRALELDENQMNMEDEFFQKWIKQRENLGSNRKDTITDREKNKTGSSAIKAPSQKKKDATQKELDKIQSQLDKEKKFKNYAVEAKMVRKPIDVSIISAATIEAFIKFLNITEDDNDYDMSLKLNGSMKLQES